MWRLQKKNQKGGRIMKAKTKFMKMYYKLPEKARQNVVFDPYGMNPRTLTVCSLEIKANTPLGKDILKKLGYEDD